MADDQTRILCRFQLTNFARHGASPLYEWIVHVARREGLRGATVLKGLYGLSSRGDVLAGHAWRPSNELPVVVEVIDEPDAVSRLLAHVEPRFHDGVVTLERVHVVRNGVRSSGGDLPFPEVRTMKLPEQGVLMRIFIGESDRDRERDLPLFESIVQRAREAHLAGATVLRGPLGFGRHSRVHAARLLELSTDLPVVVEIVDSAENIDAFLPVVHALVSEGLVTTEAVRVLKYVSPDQR